MIILVSVQDLVILSPELSGVKWAKKELKNLLNLTNMWKIKYCLGSLKGMEDRTFLLQLTYCYSILKQFVAIPMTENIEDLFLKPVLSEAEPKEWKAFPTVP